MIIKHRYIINLFLYVGMYSAALFSSQAAEIEDFTKYVNPFIGTDYTGNTYPGVQMPHGLVQLSPDNGLPGWDRIAGYFYPDSTIAGFSHTHLSGTGAGDLYDISFMPVVEPVKIADKPLGVHSKFYHDSESACAGYYKVTLADYDIDVELTATEHCGIQRYTWPGKEGKVILNLAKATNWDATKVTDVEIVDSVTIRGSRFSDGWARNQKVWFETRFSKPFAEVETDTVGGHVVTFSFDTHAGEKLVVVTAISGTDARGAHSNIVAEAPHDSFERYLADAKSAWNKALKKIEISTGDIDEKTVFYTALYHSLLAPVVFSDVDGRYRGPDGVVHQCAEGHKHYSTFSTWDTYRAAHPLFTILEPTAAADMAQSLIDFGIQNGRLPVWNMWASETDMMIGYHSVPIIVDAILKKLPGIDAEAALGECIRTARKDDYRSIGEYRRLGYVPFDKDSIWSLSKTLEYAYDDACIARLAEYLGDDSIYREFTQRAQNYLNVYNSETGFMQPKRSDGSFTDTFNPQQYTEDICESNAWQYLWSVQHDIPGLIELLGGKTALEKKLDLFFSEKADSASLPLFSTGMIGQYAHGNEPSHHVAYLYNYTNHPEKGREYLRQIMTTLYKNAPDGLCGNEDCGQMSAWYVLSSLGFYPLDPVSGEYEIGCPMFESAKIHLDNGNTFNVCRKDLNNNTSRKIKHSDIVNGRTIKP